MDSRIIGLTIIFNKRNKKDEGIKTSKRFDVSQNYEEI